MEAKLINSTRNQSTAVFNTACVFVGNNRYENGTLSNATEAVLTNGMLVVRDTTKAGGYKLADDTNLADVVGVLNVGITSMTAAANADVSVAVAVKGDLNANLLALPSTITLDTVVGNKVLRDVLEGIGLHLINYTEQTQIRR